MFNTSSFSSMNSEDFRDYLLMSTSFSQQSLGKMLDLHGFSVPEAKTRVQEMIMNAGIRETVFRFVTGRGNHINSRGERGILYKEFPAWIEELNLGKKIKEVKSFDGYYEVILNSPFKLFERVLANKGIIDKLKEQSMPSIKEHAEAGNAEAQYILGEFFELDACGQRDDRQAVFWYKKAAEQEHPYAQYSLAMCYWAGKGVRQNDKLGREWLEKSANHGNSMAECDLGTFYLDGIGIEQDFRKAVCYFAKSAKHGSREAKRKLGFCYAQGRGVSKNAETAFKYYLEAAQEGDLYSQYNVATCYENAAGTSQDYQQAFKYYQLAAFQGDFDAQCALGKCYLRGIGTSQSEEDGIIWLNKAADTGHASANYLLFHFYFSRRELAVGMGYLRKAAEANMLMAQLVLIGFAKFPPEFSGLSPEEGPKWLKRVQAQPQIEIEQLQHAEMQYFACSLLMFSPTSTKREKQKGFNVLTKLAETGRDVIAQRQLAKLYTQGEVIKQNLEKAVHYWQLGASQDDEICIVSLARCYEKGLGVRQDFREAKKWLEKGVILKSAYAYATLAGYYFEGIGVERNPHLVYEYLTTAIVIEEEKLASRLKEDLTDTMLPSSNYNLGLLHLEPFENFPGDEAKGIEYLRKAIEYGHENGVITVMKYYIQTDWRGKPDSLHEATLSCLRLSVEKGFRHAAWLLSDIYFHNPELEPRLEPIVLQLIMANLKQYVEENTDSGAELLIAKLIFAYETSLAAMKEGRRYLKLAASKQHNEAQMLLGAFYIRGFYGTKFKPEKGGELVQKWQDEEDSIDKLKYNLSLFSEHSSRNPTNLMHNSDEANISTKTRDLRI